MSLAGAFHVGSTASPQRMQRRKSQSSQSSKFSQSAPQPPQPLRAMQSRKDKRKFAEHLRHRSEFLAYRQRTFASKVAASAQRRATAAGQRRVAVARSALVARWPAASVRALLTESTADLASGKLAERSAPNDDDATTVLGDGHGHPTAIVGKSLMDLAREEGGLPFLYDTFGAEFPFLCCRVRSADLEPCRHQALAEVPTHAFQGSSGVQGGAPTYSPTSPSSYDRNDTSYSPTSPSYEGNDTLDHNPYEPFPTAYHHSYAPFQSYSPTSPPRVYHDEDDSPYSPTSPSSYSPTSPSSCSHHSPSDDDDALSPASLFGASFSLSPPQR